MTSLDRVADPSPRARALLIAPRYFGYENDIAIELREQGFEVDLLPDRPFDAPFLKAVTRLRPELTRGAADRYFALALERLGRREYDLIWVIQGESVSGQTLRRLRAAFPRARFIYYTWDSLDNKPFATANLAHYDRCLTFDPIDARERGMCFRPLFFAPGFDRQSTPDFSYDLSFVGTVHSDRYRVVRQVDGELPERLNRYWYLFIQASWMYWGRRLLTRTVAGSTQREFRFAPLAKAEVHRIYFASKVILDIEHPRQRGLTMRTIETLGSGTKLVTTNAAVRDYDFYDAANICIVDRRRPRIEPSFLERPYVALRPEVRQRYSLGSWIREARSD